ncbi:hypothetical protein PMAYCL1PPCAC_10434 [Pristionchus mayeri]|uniref:Uncharacterized protein n=1 Tax=Pristionchus mayeri TaxID=1317129 RepID=A0AAN4ZI03_9BILA|nr:hypothetical protein PMAYCL1PPCAC_10434 [Pristionchus mayeri]
MPCGSRRPCMPVGARMLLPMPMKVAMGIRNRMLDRANVANQVYVVPPVSAYSNPANPVLPVYPPVSGPAYPTSVGPTWPGYQPHLGTPTYPTSVQPTTPVPSRPHPPSLSSTTSPGPTPYLPPPSTSDEAPPPYHTLDDIDLESEEINRRLQAMKLEMGISQGEGGGASRRERRERRRASSESRERRLEELLDEALTNNIRLEMERDRSEENYRNIERQLESMRNQTTV